MISYNVTHLFFTLELKFKFCNSLVIINKFFHSFISFFRDIKENMVVCYIMKLDLYILLC